MKKGILVFNIQIINVAGCICKLILFLCLTSLILRKNIRIMCLDSKKVALITCLAIIFTTCQYVECRPKVSF